MNETIIVDVPFSPFPMYIECKSVESMIRVVSILFEQGYNIEKSLMKRIKILVEAEQ